MGVMKSIHTRMTTSKGQLSPLERRVIETDKLIRQDELVQSNDGHSILADVTIRLGYVGRIPHESGTYLVVDTITGGLFSVLLLVAADANYMVQRFGSPRPVSLKDFNHEEYRWFRVPILAPADVAEIRKLPVA